MIKAIKSEPRGEILYRVNIQKAVYAPIMINWP